jgi:hypothetical protein
LMTDTVHAKDAEWLVAFGESSQDAAHASRRAMLMACAFGSLHKAGQVPRLISYFHCIESAQRETSQSSIRMLVRRIAKKARFLRSFSIRGGRAGTWLSSGNPEI